MNPLRTYLFNEVVSLSALILPAVDRHAVLVEFELETEVGELKTAGLETTIAKLPSKVIQSLNILSNA